MKEPAGDIIENLSMVSPGHPWWWLGALGAVFLFAAVMVFLHLRRKSRNPVFSARPEKSALEQLDALRELIAAGQAREFVSASSAVLRAYLEARFGLDAPRLSTEEFLHQAGRDGQLPASWRGRLAGFLHQCNAVKFAGGTLDAAQMEVLFGVAGNFVRETTPTPEEVSRR